MDARKFCEALYQAGIERFFDCVKKDDFSAFTISRQDILKNILNDVHHILFRDFRNNKAVKPTEVTLLGQTHNDDEDFKFARSHAYSAGENQETLILEANGEVHPNIDPVCLLSEGYGCNKQNFKNVITEHELYSEDAGCKDPDTGLITRFNPCLKEVERSWIIGMFLASLVAKRPGNSITVIIGENHLEAVKASVCHYLNMAGCVDSVSFTCHLSKYVERPVERPFLVLGLQPMALKNLDLIIKDMANNYAVSEDYLKDTLIRMHHRNPKLNYNDFVNILNQEEERLQVKPDEKYRYYFLTHQFFPPLPEGSDGSSFDNENSSQLSRVFSK